MVMTRDKVQMPEALIFNESFPVSYLAQCDVFLKTMSVYEAREWLDMTLTGWLRAANEPPPELAHLDLVIIVKGLTERRARALKLLGR